jgi:diketogulonate reductase-like aldo/keto reductase
MREKKWQRESDSMIGLGLFRTASGSQTEQVVSDALEIGYRHFDTAAIYGNEADVGRAIRQSGMDREQLFVTTKLWNNGYGKRAAVEQMERSLERLGMDYVDQWLVHAPPPPSLRLSTWEGMIECLQRGYARSIGVSNFGIHHLQDLLHHGTSMPIVNQMEVTPYLRRADLVAWCEQHDIRITAYSPLTKGVKLRDPQLLELAAAHGKTAAQVLLRWGIQKGYTVIPKTISRERLAENFDVFDFSLSAAQMAQLEGWDEHLITGWDPTTSP